MFIASLKQVNGNQVEIIDREPITEKNWMNGVYPWEPTNEQYVIVDEY